MIVLSIRRRMFLVFVLALAVPSRVATSFILGKQSSLSAPYISTPSSSTTATTSLHMISNLPGMKKKKENDNLDLPRDVKDAVSVCRQSVQKALEQRKSRMIVDMPVGAKFGVEKASSSSKKKKSALSAMRGDDDSSGAAPGAPTQEMLDTSDRELARLFVEMFQPVGGENIAVVFNQGELADLAGKKWKGDATATCKIMALNRRKNIAGAARGKGMGGGKGKKKKKNMGFAAKLAAEVEDDADSGSGGGGGGPFKLPDGCEVALFISPGPREYIIIERICNEVGMGTLVLLLNARLEKMEKYASAEAEELFTKDFESIFHLAASPYQNVSPNCLVYHAYPNDWILARKPKVGPPKTIARQEGTFSEEDCRLAFENLEIGDVEKGVEDVLENVANWFK